MAYILVVDDDPAITTMLRRGLAYEGFSVAVASSGSAGLALARQQPPDLVILDIMMPGMDGLEVLRRLRAADPQLPVILLTAKDAPTDQVHGLETGADDYIIKPFTFEVLLARVRVLLRRHQAEQPQRLSFANLTLDLGAHSARRGERPITLTKTTAEPTERSRSLLTMTKVMPTAMMVTTAVIRPTAAAVRSVAKFGATMTKNAMMTRKMM